MSDNKNFIVELQDLIRKTRLLMNQITGFIDNILDIKKGDIKLHKFEFKRKYLRKKIDDFINHNFYKVLNLFVIEYNKIKHQLPNNIQIYFNENYNYIETTFNLYKDKFKFICAYILDIVDILYPYNIGLMNTYSLTPLTSNDYDFSDLLEV